MTNNKGWSTKGAVTYVAMYETYKQSSKAPTSLAQYKKILDATNAEFMRLVVKEGKEVRMPYLNMLAVEKKKREAFNRNVDYDHYRKTGEIISHENSHSDGYLARFHWSKSKAVVIGKKIYSFKPNRVWSRQVAQELKKVNGHTKYTEYAG